MAESGLLRGDSLASSWSDVYSDGLGDLGVGHREGARHLVGGRSCASLSTLLIVRTRRRRGAGKMVSPSFGCEASEPLSGIDSVAAVRRDSRTGELLLSFGSTLAGPDVPSVSRQVCARCVPCLVPGDVLINARTAADSKIRDEC